MAELIIILFLYGQLKIIMIFFVCGTPYTMAVCIWHVQVFFWLIPFKVQSSGTKFNVHETEMRIADKKPKKKVLNRLF